MTEIPPLRPEHWGGGESAQNCDILGMKAISPNTGAAGFADTFKGEMNGGLLLSGPVLYIVYGAYIPTLQKFLNCRTIRSLLDYYVFLFILVEEGAIKAWDELPFLALALALAFAPPFVLLVLQRAQYHMSGMAVLFTLAQARCTHVLQQLHSIIGRPPYGFLQ